MQGWFWHLPATEVCTLNCLDFHVEGLFNWGAAKTWMLAIKCGIPDKHLLKLSELLVEESCGKLRDKSPTVLFSNIPSTGGLSQYFLEGNWSTEKGSKALLGKRICIVHGFAYKFTIMHLIFVILYLKHYSVVEIWTIPV